MNRVCISILLLFLIGCKKDEKSLYLPVVEKGTLLEQRVDSLYLYLKETSLWYKDIPAYTVINPRKYVKEGEPFLSMQAVLNELVRWPLNPATGSSYEYREGRGIPLYSYLAQGRMVTGRRGESGTAEAGNDMGLGFVIADNNEVFISYVEPGSSAEAGGAKRGMKVLRIEGVEVPLNSSLLNDLLRLENMEIVIQDEEGIAKTIRLQKKEYTVSPVLHRSVISESGNAVGYVVISRFSTLTAGKPFIDEAIASIEASGITSIIVDLRYNGGGYVETAEYVANRIAPSGLEGKMMYREEFNELLQQQKTTMLQTIPYLDGNGNVVVFNGRPATYADIDFSLEGNTYYFKNEGGSKGIKTIVFIVSEQTASASELLINIFRPYMDVQVVGAKTFGKPVGYFGIEIGEYTLYTPQFRLVNAAGSGEYYNGIIPIIEAADDITKNWGDPDEESLKKALAYLRKERRIHTAASMPVKKNTVYIQHKEAVPFIKENRRLLK